MSKKKGKKKTNRFVKYTSFFIWAILLLVLSIVSYIVLKANILPIKYLIGMFAILIMYLLIYGLFLFKKKTHAIILIILDILSIGIISGGIYVIPKFDEALDFLRNNLKKYTDGKSSEILFIYEAKIA